MNNELKYIFSNINEWLKFSEAKHAGLLVLNSALVIGVTSQYSNLEILDKYPTTFSLSILGLSIAGSLLAQFPVTSNLLIRQMRLENPNIYFFGDLSKISESNFIDAFKSSFPDFTPNNSDKNLINQILVNAKITESKFRVFKFSCYLTFFGIGLLGFSTIIKILWS